MGFVFDGLNVQRLRDPDQLRFRMLQAQLDLAPRVSFVLGALDFASRPLIEHVHGESRPAQFGADPLVVLRRVVWRRDLLLWADKSKEYW
jgi:hypothetical protein